LERFVAAQDAAGIYEMAIDELRRGRKASHWMWYVFPQIVGLGQSEMSKKFAISSFTSTHVVYASGPGELSLSQPSPRRDDHRINLQVPTKEHEGEDAVEVTNTMGAAELLRKYLAEADPDLLRSMVQSFAEALMSAEASGLCNAEHGEVTRSG
jgi:hypothetical protein